MMPPLNSRKQTAPQSNKKLALSQWCSHVLMLKDTNAINAHAHDQTSFSVY